MRWILMVLAAVGIVAASLALHEHYFTGVSPCDINTHWDCGIVNHSPYAVLWGIPVAAIGIAGYLLMGVLAWKRAYRLLLLAAVVGLAFSLHLARIESHILGVWCIYCVISLAAVALITLTSLGAVLTQWIRPPRSV
jgi:vitamin-K-epoxide reductase (warfarin-sensitive)